MAEFEIVPVKIFPDDLLTVMDTEADQVGSMRAYIGRINTEYRDTDLIRFMSLLGHSLVIPDLMPAEEQRAIKETFFQASLLGIRVVASCVEDIEVLTSVLPTGVTDPNQPGRRDPADTARQLLMLGRSGYSMLADMLDTSVVDKWAPAICPDPDMYKYVECGIGFPVLLLAAVIRRNEDLASQNNLVDRVVEQAAAEFEVYAELAAETGMDILAVADQLSK